MPAIFTLEAGMLMDTGASDQGGLLFGRQAFVGLKTAVRHRAHGPHVQRRSTKRATPTIRSTAASAATTAASSSLAASATTIRSSTIRRVSAASRSRRWWRWANSRATPRRRARWALSLFYKKGNVDFKLAWDATNNNPTGVAPVVTTRSTAIGGNYKFPFGKLFAVAQVNRAARS